MAEKQASSNEKSPVGPANDNNRAASVAVGDCQREPAPAQQGSRHRARKRPRCGAFHVTGGRKMPKDQPNSERINWKGADLRGVNMAGVNLEGADLRASDLRGTNFT